MKYYLGHHIVRDRQNRKIYLDQSAMITDMASKFNIPLNGPFPSTPMEYLPQANTTKIFLNEKGITDYQSRVGSVLYIAMHSRPDILFATSTCTTKTKQPTSHDLIAINRIISYLVSTKELALKLGSDEGILLYGTVDASYATHDDSKSTQVLLFISAKIPEQSWLHQKNKKLLPILPQLQNLLQLTLLPKKFYGVEDF
jgi:hypothetical protein